MGSKKMTGAVAGNLFLESVVGPLAKQGETYGAYTPPTPEDVRKARIRLKTTDDRIVYDRYESFGLGLKHVIQDVNLNKQTFFHAYYRISGAVKAMNSDISALLNYEAAPIVTTREILEDAKAEAMRSQNDVPYYAIDLICELIRTIRASSSFSFHKAISREAEKLLFSKFDDEQLFNLIRAEISNFEKSQYESYADTKRVTLMSSRDGQRQLFSIAKSGGEIKLRADEKRFVQKGLPPKEYPKGRNLYEVLFGEFYYLTLSAISRDKANGLRMFKKVAPDFFDSIVSSLSCFDIFPADYFAEGTSSVTLQELYDCKILNSEECSVPDPDDIVLGILCEKRGFSFTAPGYYAVASQGAYESSECLHGYLRSNISISSFDMKQQKDVYTILLKPALKHLVAAKILFDALCECFPFGMLSIASGEFLDSVESSVERLNENVAATYCNAEQYGDGDVLSIFLENTELTSLQKMQPSKARVKKVTDMISSMQSLPREEDVIKLYSILTKEA